MKNLTFPAVLMAMVILFSCKTQPAANSKPVDEFQVTKVIYHLGRCNGMCPSIDLEIDSARAVYVNREFYKTKSEVDSANSGRFKGTLTIEQDKNLIAVLKKSNLDSLEFAPAGISDVSETTIIVYYNGKRKYLKSARPPAVANDLITLLKSIANDKVLVRTTETKEIEN